MPDEARKPFVRTPDEGLSIENPVGGVLTFKGTAEATHGTFTAIETVAAPGEGPPLHLHRDHDETIYALDGRFRVKLADRLVEVSAGSFVFIPRGTAHTWQNVGDTRGRFFAMVLPADPKFEQFFVHYSQIPHHERSFERFARVAQETQAFEVLGPPLADSAPR